MLLKTVELHMLLKTVELKHSIVADVQPAFLSAID